MKHWLTVDVEDWFQVYFAERAVPRDAWTSQVSKIHTMLDVTLDLFEAHNVKGTFFFVGWLAQHHPSLLRRVSEKGHEIASHGFWHQEYAGKELSVLRADVGDAKKAIEDAIGRPIQGFRAPGFSIQSAKDPAIDIILEAGHRYDSSVFSREHQPYEIRPGLLEVPPNSLTLGARHLPSGGGFVFRAIPYLFFKVFAQFLEANKVALNFYTHTWELYSDYPRLPLGLTKSFVQYFNLGGTRSKVSRLLSDFTFEPIQSYLGNRL